VDIQKLRIVPADNLPMILSDFNIKPRGLINNDTKNINIEEQDQLIGKRLPIGYPTDFQGPSIKFRDGPIASIEIESTGLLGLNAFKRVSPPNLEKETSSNMSFKFNNFTDFIGLGQLTAKDKAGPEINNFDVLIPEVKTVSARVKKFTANIGVGSSSAVKTASVPETGQGSASSFGTLNIFAVKPSWIRISDIGKKVVFEKILKSGEVLKIKRNWLNGNLRAGNAKDLFFSLDGVTYGPVSETRKVITKFKIDPEYIFDSLKINLLKDSFLNKTYAQRESL
jgi:hypothetical protein